jgi:hypothetical protein
MLVLRVYKKALGAFRESTKGTRLSVLQVFTVPIMDKNDTLWHEK